MIDFEHEQETAFFENGPSARRIYSGKEELGNIRWFYNDQYVLFSEGNQLMAQDFEGNGGSVKLFSISKSAGKIALDRRGFVYFAHPEGDRLCRTKISEETGFLPRLVDNLVEATKEPK